MVAVSEYLELHMTRGADARLKWGARGEAAITDRMRSPVSGKAEPGGQNGTAKILRKDLEEGRDAVESSWRERGRRVGKGGQMGGRGAGGEGGGGGARGRGGGGGGGGTSHNRGPRHTDRAGSRGDRGSGPGASGIKDRSTRAGQGQGRCKR